MRLPLVHEPELSSAGGCGGGARMSAAERRRAERKRLPLWFRTRLPSGEGLERFDRTKGAVIHGSLNTVCQEARCPNIHDCWSRGTATFMVAGETCTRGCRFCAVGTIKQPPPLDPEEPARLASTVASMGLDHAVITCVNRDDLDDGGAAHYRACLMALHETAPSVGLEFLCSDLDGDLDSLALLLDGLPIEVFAHNVECVPRLDPIVRDPRASFEQSIAVLSEAKRLRSDVMTKSSLMVGVGESDEEVSEAIVLLREAGVDMLTIGQYLQPSDRHLPIDRFPSPERFADWDAEARSAGFMAVAAGPLVRSSYRAGRLLAEARGESSPVALDPSGSAVSHVVV